MDQLSHQIFVVIFRISTTFIFRIECTFWATTLSEFTRFDSQKPHLWNISTLQ